MATALSALNLRIKFNTIDPVLDPPSFDLNYFTTYTTQDISDVADLVSKVTTSLGTTHGGSAHSPNQLMNKALDNGTNKSLVDVSDISNHLDGTPHGSPVLLSSFTLAASGSITNAPFGCCAVITLQAPYGTDVEFGGSPPGKTRPRARDRGRIYFGPLNLSSCMVDDSTSNRTKLGSAVGNDLCQWIKSINVITTTPHTIVYNLGVWSRKNAAIKSLQEVWVDDRIDYQRRREDQGVVKTILGLP